MLEVALIAVCIIAGVAYACGRVGYRLGAKSAARQITRVFQREITSKDNELDKVEGQLRHWQMQPLSDLHRRRRAAPIWDARARP
jgi:hypothetical protein